MISHLLRDARVALLMLGTSVPTLAQAPDLEAVGTKLLESVAAGQLTGEQAADMIAALARSRFEQRLRAQAERLGPDAAPGSSPEPTARPFAGPPGDGDAFHTPEKPAPASDDAAAPLPKSEVEVARAFADLGLTRFDYDRMRRLVVDRGAPEHMMGPIMGALLLLIRDDLRLDDSHAPRAERRTAFLDLLPIDPKQFALMERLASRTAKILRADGGGGAPSRDKPDAASPYTRQYPR